MSAPEPMTKKRVRAWITALTSGKYKQCRGTIASLNSDHTPEAYCCLGVLAEIEDTHSHGFLTYPSMSEKLKEECVNKNDSKKWSFNQIAAWLKEKYNV